MLYYHLSISSNENKMSTNLETSTSNVFKSVYYVPYILQSTSNSLFLYLILDLNIYTFFQSFPGNSYRSLFFFFFFFLSKLL